MPRLVEVAPGVLVATSRFMVTNTTVVTGGDRALVVDPGVHPDEFDDLVAQVRDRGLTVDAGLATHAHWDHVLWDERLGDVPRWASGPTVLEARTHHGELVDQARHQTTVDESRLGRLVPVEGSLPWDPLDAELIVHDAHATGHAAAWLPAAGVLLAGDMVSDVEVPLLDADRDGPAALARYHEGLDRLSGLTGVRLVVTGHGRVCDGTEWRRRIDADRRYLDELAAGWPTSDDRLATPWLAVADREMRSALTKQAWRQWARQLPDVDPATSGAVAAGLARYLGPDPGLVAAYLADHTEVDLAALVEALPQVVLPRVDTDGLSWHRADGPLELHRIGVLQPAADAPPVATEDIDVFLVPGRVFDRHGIRLGRGAGHYDRVLPQRRPGATVIGVTTDARVVPRLPTEDHDVAMTHLATERGVVATDGP